MVGRCVVSAVLGVIGLTTGGVAAGAQPYSGSTGTLSVTPQVVTAGQSAAVSGSGYRSGGTVDLAFESTPVALTTAVAGTDGRFTAQITIPANATTGVHHIVATGPAPDNATLILRAELTVQSSGSASGAGTAGSTAGGGTSSGGGLPFTGANIAVMVLVAAVLVVAGAAIWSTVRRRRGDASAS